MAICDKERKNRSCKSPSRSERVPYKRSSRDRELQPRSQLPHTIHRFTAQHSDGHSQHNHRAQFRARRIVVIEVFTLFGTATRCVFWIPSNGIGVT
ncbi:UNVERIFIED_CONTAM: hypothetical protein FKN15_022175 [Acipenser sinensis]